jgi:hypothetical protein
MECVTKILNTKGDGKTKEPTTTTKKASVTSKGSGKVDTNTEAGGAAKGADYIKENDRCNFKGLVSDKENCQSKFNFQHSKVC